MCADKTNKFPPLINVGGKGIAAVQSGTILKPPEDGAAPSEH